MLDILVVIGRLSQFFYLVALGERGRAGDELVHQDALKHRKHQTH